MNNGIIGVIAQIFGALAVIVALFIFIFKSRKVILTAKLTDDVLWSVYYFLTGGMTAGALNCVGVVREIVFYNREKKWASSRLWLYGFLAVTAAAGVLTWEGMSSVFAMLGMILAVFSFWCSDPILICSLSIPSELSWLIYNIIHDAKFGIVSSSVAVLSAVVGLILKLTAKKREEKKDG